MHVAGNYQQCFEVYFQNNLIHILLFWCPSFDEPDNEVEDEGDDVEPIDRFFEIHFFGFSLCDSIKRGKLSKA